MKVKSSTPVVKNQMYHCICPDCSFFISMDVETVVLPMKFIVPSTMCRSNQATGLEISWKMILCVMNK